MFIDIIKTPNRRSYMKNDFKTKTMGCIAQSSKNYNLLFQAIKLPYKMSLIKLIG